jgi:hypothetical protein
MKVQAQCYASSHVILLAFNWEDGQNLNNFIGFAIERTPGVGKQKKSFLYNRIGFNGPLGEKDHKGSNKYPIQKFMWWDAQINDADEGQKFTYTIYPALYKNNKAELQLNNAGTITVTVPSHDTEHGKISTYFNRAVVSSQSFSRQFLDKNDKFIEAKRHQAYKWLANGLSDAFTRIVDGADAIEGAVYHLNDFEWVVPRLGEFKGPLSMVMDNHVTPTNGKTDPNEDARDELIKLKKSKVEFFDRSKTNIMHNKFLVHMKNKKAEKVMMGSANFTTGALTSQANLLHIFDSAELADLFLERKRLLENNPTKGDTAAEAEWSKTIKIGDTRIKAFFSPEPGAGKKENKGRIALAPVVEAIRKAKQSIVFCIFTPTDNEVRSEIFDQADNGKMMFGLINSISSKEPELKKTKSGKPRGDAVTRIEIYHRNRKNRDVYAHAAFTKMNTPGGLLAEISSLREALKIELDDDGEGGQPAGKKSNSAPEVYIHHKFIVVDGETDNPIVYTGSANISDNSCYNNDENMLEIRGSKAIARTYLAEFIRLYEHYRARAYYNQYSKAKKDKKKKTAKEKKVLNTFKLKIDNSWATKDYTEGTPEFKARLNMVK